MDAAWTKKTTLWDKASLIRIAIRMPDRSHAGTESPRPISSIDFYPTLMEMCGLVLPHTNRKRA